MSRFAEIVPQNPLEFERFYLDAIEKLKGTNMALADLEVMPTAAISLHELNRAIEGIARMSANLRLENHELRRRIDNLERSI